jgi:hypothetical protein
VPLTIPTLDNSSYQDILNEAVARIPVYTPEWTNFNKSDPGVTILEIFAFLNENLLFVANQVPEQNRLKFLTLLGLGLQPAASSAGRDHGVGRDSAVPALPGARRPPGHRANLF